MILFPQNKHFSLFPLLFHACVRVQLVSYVSQASSLLTEVCFVVQDQSLGSTSGPEVFRSGPTWTCWWTGSRASVWAIWPPSSSRSSQPLSIFWLHPKKHSCRSEEIRFLLSCLSFQGWGVALEKSSQTFFIHSQLLQVKAFS